MNPQWLTWAQQLQAIAQTGLTYAQNKFDVERYEAIRRISAEMMTGGFSWPDVKSAVAIASFEGGYATPKVDVRAAVFRDDQVLLVKEVEDGGWTLPGGWADVGDSPSKAAVREVKEESGFDVAATKLAAVYDRNLHGHPPIPYHAYKLFFVCDLLGGTAQTSHETDGVGFFSEDEWPPLSLSRTTPEQLKHLFAHYRNPDLPTSFD